MAYCGKCGIQLEDDAKFCPKCGAPVDGIEDVGKKDVEDQEEIRIKRVIVAFAITIIFILGVIGYFNNKKTEEAAKAQEKKEELIRQENERIQREREREEERKPQNVFYKIASQGEYVWQCSWFGYDFGRGERTLLYFYPSSPGGGRMTYLNVDKDYKGSFLGFSTTALYTVSDDLITAQIRGRTGWGIEWTKNLMFLIEKNGEEISLKRIIDNSGAKGNVNEVYYYQRVKPMKDPYN